MPYPTLRQYHELIEQKGTSAFPSLSGHQFLYEEVGGFKQFCFGSGNSAAVFKTVSDGKYYAIRCFLDGEEETFRRYREIAPFLRGLDADWKVDVELLEAEVILEGRPYPVLLMDWAEGRPMNEFIATHSGQAEPLSRLQDLLIHLSRSFEAIGMGHGDLKYNNILLREEGSELKVKVVDYDSMYLPSFRGRRALEIGTPGFQPLRKLITDYSERMDRFSFWVALTTLEALKEVPRLWPSLEKSRQNPDHSLFSSADLARPEDSALFNLLRALGRPSLDFYIDRLTQYCTVRDLNTIDAPVRYGEAAERSESSSVKREAVTERREPTVERREPTSQRRETKVEQPVTRNHQPATSYPPPEPPPIVRRNPVKRPADSRLPARDPKKRSLKPVLLVVGILLAAALGYYGVSAMRSGETPSAPAQYNSEASAPAALEEEAPLFTEASVTNFLSRLYSAYNNRDLDGIVGHYTNPLNRYYDAEGLSRDSLRTVVRDLFISTAGYSCRPDFATMELRTERNLCTVTITIQEQLRSTANGPVDQYDTRIEYVLDSTFRIRSERQP